MNHSNHIGRKRKEEHFQNDRVSNANMGNATNVSTTVLVFMIIWVVTGLAAFFASIMCFGRSGTTGEKFLGLLLAFFLGPFYWLYFFLNPDYCR
jgi:hypothetical protein